MTVIVARPLVAVARVALPALVVPVVSRPRVTVALVALPVLVVPVVSGPRVTVALVVVMAGAMVVLVVLRRPGRRR